MKLYLDADPTALLSRLPPILACGNARNSALQAASSHVARNEAAHRWQSVVALCLLNFPWWR